MRAFLEKADGDYLDDFVFTSKYQLRNLDVNVIDFDGAKLSILEKYHFNLQSDIMIGSVDAINYFFKECGIESPKHIGYPSELNEWEFLLREIKTIKFKDLEDTFVSFPIFIKPKNDVKLFTGEIIKNRKSYEFMRDTYKQITPDTEIYVSTIVNFISEYRCFVHNGQLRGIQYYTGDFRVFPDSKVIENMVDTYKSCPIAYALDVGITDKGDTVLVEVNDMWGTGSYGFNAKEYVRMTIDRFQEIYKTSKVVCH